MATTQSPQTVKPIHPASVMSPATDERSTPDIVAQLRALEHEVMERNRELQARLDTIEPETRDLKEDAAAARDSLEGLGRALAAVQEQIQHADTRTESLESITRSLSESSGMISQLLDDAVARLGSRADHQDDRIKDADERLRKLAGESTSLNGRLENMADQLKVTGETIDAVDEKHSDWYAKLNDTLMTAAAKLKDIDQHQAGQINNLEGRLNSLEPAHEDLDRRHGALQGEAHELRDRLDSLEPRHNALKSAHNSLAVHVSDLDVKTDRTNTHMRRGAWTAGAVALLIAAAAGIGLWQGYDNRAGLSAAITEQGNWVRDETASLWSSVTGLNRRTDTVDARVSAVGEQVATVDERVAAVDGRVTEVADHLGGKVATIEDRIYASDRALDGAPVDMAAIKGEEWLATQPAGNYVIQLLGSYSQRSLANLIARHRDVLDIAGFSYIKTTHNGRDWFALMYGSYADFDAATTAMGALPQRLQKSGPYVRTVGGALKSAARG